MKNKKPLSLEMATWAGPTSTILNPPPSFFSLRFFEVVGYEKKKEKEAKKISIRKKESQIMMETVLNDLKILFIFFDSLILLTHIL